MCPPGQKKFPGVVTDVRSLALGGYPMLNCLLKNWKGGSALVAGYGHDKMTMMEEENGSSRCQCHVGNKIRKDSFGFIVEENNNNNNSDLVVGKEAVDELTSKLIDQKIKQNVTVDFPVQVKIFEEEPLEEGGGQRSIESESGSVKEVMKRRRSILKNAKLPPGQRPLPSYLPKQVQFSDQVDIIPGRGGMEQEEEKVAAALEREQQRKKIARMRLRQNLILIENFMILEAAKTHTSQRRFANFLH